MGEGVGVLYLLEGSCSLQLLKIVALCKDSRSNWVSALAPPRIYHEYWARYGLTLFVGVCLCVTLCGEPPRCVVFYGWLLGLLASDLSGREVEEKKPTDLEVYLGLCCTLLCKQPMA